MNTNKLNGIISMIVITLSITLNIIFGFLLHVSLIKPAPIPNVEYRIVKVYITSQDSDTTSNNTTVEDTTVEDTTVEDTEPREKAKDTPTPTRSGSREFIITAYDNSIESQGKWVNQTATGFDLKGHTRDTAKCIAVDPKVIPLGSKVELIFDDEYAHLNDIYIARDTGGAIKGDRIDLFMGDGVDKKIVRDFGKRKVKVRVLD